jgi:hypothetical protein
MGLYNAVIGGKSVVGSLAGGTLAKSLGYGASFGTPAALMALTAIWLWRLRATVAGGNS